MSTKAYDFYIFERKHLNKFMKWANENIYSVMLDTFLSNSELKNILLNRIYHRDAKETYNKISEAMQSECYGDFDDFDLLCGVSFWFWKENVVIKLYGLNKLKKCKLPKYAKNFEYWNNTDRPEEVTSIEWRKRERFFENTIENIERLDYQPLDFLSRGRYGYLLKLHRYYIKNLNMQDTKYNKTEASEN